MRTYQAAVEARIAGGQGHLVFAVGGGGAMENARSLELRSPFEDTIL